MKKILLTILLLFVTGAVLAQVPPVVFKNSGRSVAWDYQTVLMKSVPIVRFELSYDNGAFATVGIPTAFTDANTTANSDSYSATIPNTLALGTHTVRGIACAATFCSDPSAPFTFVFDALPAPSGLRVK